MERQAEAGTCPAQRTQLVEYGAKVADIKSVTLKVEGMHCTSCTQTVKAFIATEPGVREANVSYKDRVGRVLYDPQATDEDRLIKAIEAIGYGASARRS